MFYIAPIIFTVLLFLARSCLKKACLFGNVISGVLKCFAYCVYIFGFSYGYTQVFENYYRGLDIWFAAFSVGSILLALSEIIRLIYLKR